MKKVAITGANSYTGRYIAKELLKQNVEIINISNKSNRKHDLG
jgi:nucleoside-diphosphate-sugar epimerase